MILSSFKLSQTNKQCSLNNIINLLRLYLTLNLGFILYLVLTVILIFAFLSGLHKIIYVINTILQLFGFILFLAFNIHLVILATYNGRTFEGFYLKIFIAQVCCILVYIAGANVLLIRNWLKKPKRFCSGSGQRLVKTNTKINSSKK